MIPFASPKLRAATLQGQLVEYVGGRVLRGSQFVRESLWVEDGKILDPQKVPIIRCQALYFKIFFDRRERPAFRVNCEGLIIAPGFVELQINGSTDSDT